MPSDKKVKKPATVKPSTTQRTTECPAPTRSAMYGLETSDKINQEKNEQLPSPLDENSVDVNNPSTKANAAPLAESATSDTILRTNSPSDSQGPNTGHEHLTNNPPITAPMLNNKQTHSSTQTDNTLEDPIPVRSPTERSQPKGSPPIGLRRRLNTGQPNPDATTEVDPSEEPHQDANDTARINKEKQSLNRLYMVTMILVPVVCLNLVVTLGMVYTNQTSYSPAHVAPVERPSDVREKLEKLISEEITPVKKELDSYGKSVGHNKQMIDELKDEVQKVGVQQHHFNTRVGQLSDKLAEKETEILAGLKALKDKDIKQMSKRIGTIRGELNKTVADNDEAKKGFTENQQRMESKMNSQMRRLQTLGSKIETYRTDVDAKAANMIEKLKSAEGVLTEFDTKMVYMTSKLSSHDEDLDTAFNNLFNKRVAMIVIVVILSMNIGLGFAVYILCQNRSKTSGRLLQQGTSQNGPQDAYYNPVLDQIPVNPILLKAVGVISFSEQYQREHTQLVQSVIKMIDKRVDVMYHVVLKDQDISNIPRCSLMIICIEYSDRDVIIEESGYALGDCNKTTLMAVQQIGAVPIIIYNKDLRSQHLQKGRIFSQGIRCATHQKELKPLSSDDRFYSVYDQFNEHQKAVLKTTIEEHALSK